MLSSIYGSPSHYIRVKICGITKEEDLEAAVRAGADAVGFVVNVPSSPRNLSFERALELMSKTPPFVDRVVVTIPSTPTDIFRIHEELSPEFIQVHGDPRVDEFLAGIARSTKRLRIIRAINVTSESSLSAAKAAAEHYCGIHLNSLVHGKLGGTGIKHDWKLSKRIRDEVYPVPVILAGGLDPSNVLEAIAIVKPYAVDVSSGVEKAPGIKDRDKLEEFIGKVKKYFKEYSHP